MDRILDDVTGACIAIVNLERSEKQVASICGGV